MIRGQLIDLVAVEREHLPNYVTWFNDPDVLEYFGRLEPISLAEEEKWFEDQLQDRDMRVYAVLFQGEHVGGAGYHNIDWRNRHAEVGLLIGRKDLWNRGLGTDVMATLVRHGFEQLNFHRLYLHVFDGNKRAIRCYENVGFREEGRLRDAQFRHGRYHDMLLMSILEEDYRALRSNSKSQE